MTMRKSAHVAPGCVHMSMRILPFNSVLFATSLLESMALSRAHCSSSRTAASAASPACACDGCKRVSRIECGHGSPFGNSSPATRFPHWLVSSSAAFGFLRGAAQTSKCWPISTNEHFKMPLLLFPVPVPFLSSSSSPSTSPFLHD